MEQHIALDDKNVIVMKLLHYFITEKNYNPIILQGVENEIWLENLKEDYKVVRIVSGYIHNNEQFSFDTFKTKRIIKKIKMKTLSLNMNVVSIFLNLGDNVTADLDENPNILNINVHDEKELGKNDKITKIFPDLKKKMVYNEKGVELFVKITSDINKHNREDAVKVEKVFKSKFPYVTYLLIAMCIIFYLVPIVFGEYEYVLEAFCIHGPSIKAGQYYRLLTGMFLHANIFHLLFNCYALYVIGKQLESFLGKIKFSIIYLFSGVMGALFSCVFFGEVPSIGASGAIFGLMGSLLYFGYHYRVYLGNVMKSQIIPLIVVNLALGFILPNIDNAAHIGGLIGGGMITMALGVDNKSTTSEKVNGTIMTIIFTIFMVYLAFFFAN